MCGRFSEAVQLRVMAKRFKVEPPKMEWAPRYNLAPGQEALAVVNEDGRQMIPMRWGLIPSWAKDMNIGYKMINARAETVSEKPSYRNAFIRRRALIPADGFYEWKKPERGRNKIPMRIVLASGEPFAFAGLWEIWKNPDGKEIRSFTIITTEANERLQSIHERMPVILPADDEDRWLDPQLNDPKVLMSFLKPLPSKMVHAYEVSTVVNSAKNDIEACIQPV